MIFKSQRIIFIFLFYFLALPLNAQCVKVNQDGNLLFTSDTVQDCTGYWLIPASDYSAYISAVNINVADATSAFTWGFGTVIFFSFLAFKIAVARNIVRKV